MLLAAGLYRKLDFLLGALVGHAALILGFIRLLHSLVMLFEGFLGSLALGLHPALGAIRLFNGGQQAGFILGVIWQSNGGKIQRQPKQVIARAFCQLRSEVTPLKKFRRNYLA